MKIPFSPPDISSAEIDGVVEVLKSGWITTGPTVKQFEERIADFVGNNRAVALNSATACLEAAFNVLGIGEGDEVIVPAYTYTATASSAIHAGAKIVMADCYPGSFEVDYAKLADLVTERTKAFVPVDLGGIVCDYEKILPVLESVAGKFSPNNALQRAIGRVTVVADAAHSFGGSRAGKKAGQWADFTAYSFHAVKNLTTAEGGALTWLGWDGISDDDIYTDLQLYSLHGQSKDALAKNKAGAWEYDIMWPAHKCNMTNISAAIGLAQLDRYPNMLARRRQLIERYHQAFAPLGLSLMDHYTETSTSTGHLYLVRIPSIGVEVRNELIQLMADREIACNVHYKPLPMLSAYKNLGFDIADFPNAYAQYENLISLPIYSTMTDEQQQFVIDNFVDILRSKGLVG